jgi:hypothetical protein
VQVKISLVLLCVFVAASASADAPDWNAVADVQRVIVLTVDEDGDARETTVWLAVVDGRGYVRTSRSTRWGGNVVREPDIGLRIGDAEYPLRASFVEDEALRQRIVATFREKYGWSDGMMAVFRGSKPRIMRLDPR